MLEKNLNLDRKVIDCLSSEYQSLWVVSMEDLTMQIYKRNDELAIPGTIDIAKGMNQYDMARVWYTHSFVVEEHKERILRETELQNIVTRISNGKPFVLEYRRSVNGKENYNQLYYMRIGNKEGELTHFILGFRDIDHDKKAELDELTGLYTRNAFVRHAEKLLQENPNAQYDLIMSDYVNFKQVNERYGEKMGDSLLKAAADYLRTIIREGLVVGRYGGDQFVVLMKHEEFGNFLREADDQTLKATPTEGVPYVNVKYGICPKLQCNDSVVVACDHAHVAVNTIKEQYGQRIAVYDNQMKDRIERQRMIEQDMHIALETGQFRVYYQPKHDSRTGKVVGAEALIRWMHPTFGFMSPGEFIPLFERNGFIVEADKYVYRRTCENLERWKTEGVPLVPISVNCSKLTVANPKMMEQVTEIMNAYNAKGDLLHIEITESMMSEDMEMLSERLEELKTKGVQIELDDFGAGYASINMLSALPLDVIKLDMSFMQQFGDEKRAKVLEGCVNLAKSLGYRTVSEGVETEEQLVFLKELGVDIIQGYYYSKPLPENEFVEYLKTHNV